MNTLSGYNVPNHCWNIFKKKLSSAFLFWQGEVLNIWEVNAIFYWREIIKQSKFQVGKKDQNKKWKWGGGVATPSPTEKQPPPNKNDAIYQSYKEKQDKHNWILVVNKRENWPS